MRQAITAIAIIAVMFTATCGGHQRNGAHDAALTPTISQLSTFNSKLASVIPADVRLVARDAGIALSGGGYTLSWKYENPGDYSQDGKVAIEDITPLAQHFNEAVSPENEWIKVNGDGSGVIGVSEITPIAMNWASEVTGYRIDGAPSVNGPWNEVASVTLDEGDGTNGRLAFSSEITPGFIYYRIGTLTPDGDAAYSAILIAPSNEPIIYGVSPTSGYQHEVSAFTATASGQEPLSYSWDFGGGATPNTSSDVSPTVTLSDAGEYSATLTISNSYGPTTFPFTLTVTARDMWAHTWGGFGRSFGRGLLADDENIYVAGDDNEDALLMKYSQDGSLVWAKEFGVDGLECSQGCLFDLEGNIVTAGQSTALGEGNVDLMLLKYSADGDLLRAMTWGTSDYECVGRNFCQDDLGNIYICGQWGQSGSDVFRALVVKLDADWNVLWAKLWGGTERADAIGITTGNGAVYVCGEIGEWISPEHDAYVMKMDEDGNVLWVQRWGTSLLDVFYSLTVGIEGSIYAVGHSQPPSEPMNGVIVKYSPEGDFIKGIGWGADDSVYRAFSSINRGNRGDLFLTGGDSSLGVLAMEIDEDLSLLSVKAWKTEVLWESTNTIAIDKEGNTYLAGSGQRHIGEWSVVPDLTFIPAHTSNAAVGDEWDIVGITNEANGTETVPEGSIDTVSDYQLLIMKNYPK